MKIADARRLFPAKVIENLDVDVTSIVVHEEFHRRGSHTPYRTRAIKSLLQMNVPFETDCNLVFDVAKEFVKVTCPHCGSETEVSSSGGNLDVMTVAYRCTNDACKAEISLNFPGDRGISVGSSELKPSLNQGD
jgi:predicted RNA-binding Zn-ribbon protein involved in translation (DUF1610 family)